MDYTTDNAYTPCTYMSDSVEQPYVLYTDKLLTVIYSEMV